MTAQIENARVGDAVENAQTALAPCKKSRRGKDAELTGNIGLGGSGQVDQLRDVFFPIFQSHQEFEPGRLAQGAEARSDQLDGGLGKLRGMTDFWHKTKKILAHRMLMRSYSQQKRIVL